MLNALFFKELFLCLELFSGGFRSYLKKAVPHGFWDCCAANPVSWRTVGKTALPWIVFERKSTLGRNWAAAEKIFRVAVSDLTKQLKPFFAAA